MPMTPFYTRFLELAFREMRFVTLLGRVDIPDGEYGFLELYCDEEGCDCRRVMIMVIRKDTKDKVWATINYGWEDLKFYMKWIKSPDEEKVLKGPCLDLLNPQTKYSDVLLECFELVLKDKGYIDCLRRHYEMFKRAARNN
jgi:hypothetical protein